MTFTMVSQCWVSDSEQWCGPISGFTGFGEPSESDDAAEDRRLDALHSYGILDTPPEIAFDRIVDLARMLFDTPIALVTFLDSERQWFKARAGLDVSQTAREQAFCHYAVQQPGVMVVPDAQLDARFADNPMVTGDPGIRFYAGAPMVTPSGARLGTVCVISPQPRPGLSERDRERLQALAGIAANELELRRQSERARRLAHQQTLLVREIDHRVQSSLRLVACVVEAQASRAHQPSIRQALYEVVDRIASVETLHQHLNHGEVVFEQDVRGYLLALIGNLAEVGVDEQAGRSISLSVGDGLRLPSDAVTRVGMVTTELVANALRHGRGRVAVDVAWEDRTVIVSVTDEGAGFAAERKPLLAHDRLGLQIVSMLAIPGGMVVDPMSSRRIVVRMALGSSEV